jgi:hypothetical protein
MSNDIEDDAVTSHAHPAPAAPDLAAAVADQLADLRLDPARPVIISDADEVLFAFMRGLEDFLHAGGLYFDFSSFALTGNIRRRADDEAVAAAEVREILMRFFEGHTDSLAPVPGAAEALADLSGRGAQVVVLSNVPAAQKETRIAALARHGMDYPLVANSGGKGAAVQALAGMTQAPAVFIDDIPLHHAEVAQVAPEVMLLHFVADPRLAKLLDPAEHCHHRIDTWPEARAVIAAHLALDE